MCFFIALGADVLVLGVGAFGAYDLGRLDIPPRFVATPCHGCLINGGFIENGSLRHVSPNC